MWLSQFDIMTQSNKTLKVTYDPLTELMAHYAQQKGEKKEKAARAGTVEEQLKNRIIDGDKVGLQADLDEIGRASCRERV